MTWTPDESEIALLPVSARRAQELLLEGGFGYRSIRAIEGHRRHMDVPGRRQLLKTVIRVVRATREDGHYFCNSTSDIMREAIDAGLVVREKLTQFRATLAAVAWLVEELGDGWEGKVE